MKVKVCGICNIDDALAAVDAGADYLGFIVFPGSPRYISPNAIKPIAARLPKHITTVAVTVNPDTGAVHQLLDECDIVQLHGDETPEFVARFDVARIWKAIHLDSAVKLKLMAQYPVSAFVVDSMVKGLRGGTGVCCDWELAAQAAAKYRVILAGGINADNAVEAARAVNPYGLDIASGVELRPGVKDHDKIKQLFDNLRKENII